MICVDQLSVDGELMGGSCELDFNLLPDLFAASSWNDSTSELIEHYLGGVCDPDDQSTDDEDNGKSKTTNSSKDKRQESIDRRRERNRVLARKTRLRKKFSLETLQKQVAQLSAENDLLKAAVNQRIGHNGVGHSSLAKAMQSPERAYTMVDHLLPGCPITFASQGFLDLSGYPLEEVLGRSAFFLQGPGTDQKQVEILRKAMANGQDCSACLLNHRADGSQFYNQVFLAPLRDAGGKVISFISVQVEVASS